MRRYIDLAGKLPENILTEAPIEDYNLLGDFERNSSYRKPVDRKLLTNPKAAAKIQAQWSKTKFPFNMYFINSPEAGHHREVGMVNQAWLEANMPKALAEINIRSDAINVLYTGNSADQHVPMTGWIMAHRLSHAMDRSKGNKRDVFEVGEAREAMFRTMGSILTDAYGIAGAPQSQKQWSNARTNEYGPNWNTVYRRFYETIGTMRSARERKIRDEFEFLHELFAQYIITGKVDFNPLPQGFGFREGNSNRYARMAHPGDADYYNGLLEDLADTLYWTFENILGSVVGKTFVM